MPHWKNALKRFLLQIMIGKEEENKISKFNVIIGQSVKCFHIRA